MKAFAYAETYLRTAHSELPVTFYVLRYSLLSTIKGGTAQINTTDRSRFEQVLAEEKQRGIRIVTSRLPMGMKEIGTTTLTEDLPEPLEVEFVRQEFDRIYNN